MINRALTRRLNQWEAQLPASIKPENLHTTLFLGAEDETVKRHLFRRLEILEERMIPAGEKTVINVVFIDPVILFWRKPGPPECFRSISLAAARR